jgi:hypothetical protein
MADMFEVRWEGLDELVAQATAMQQSIRRIVVDQVGNLGQYAKYLCRIELADVRYTGALEQSFVVDIDSQGLKAKVYPTADHAMFTRMGTRPHWAPIGPLKRWAAAKLGDENLAYPVQRSIAEHGTSMYQMRKRGTKTNPWPMRVVSRQDFLQAFKRTARETGAEIIAEFVE